MFRVLRVGARGQDVRYSICNQLRRQAKCQSSTSSSRNQQLPQQKTYGRPFVSQKPDSVLITQNMTVKHLAEEIGVKPGTVIRMLCDVGEKPNGYNTVVPPDIAELILLEYDITPKYTGTRGVADIKPRPPCEDSGQLHTRPPIVTIMGHVDHGKTTLLDSLRKTSVAASEAGGITQHIGAFSVNLPCGNKITFIDTPGHAAFNSMRARGANVTDIVVLVVAADDGVKAQTVESIKHASNAGVPLIVAINKCDKPRVNMSQVKQQLLSNRIQLEEFGGDVQAVEISALKGNNLDSLLEAIITLAEVNNLKAERTGAVEGVVIESRTDRGRGPLATTLVQRGSLRRGSVIVAGTAYAKVRQMFDDKGQVVSEARPSTAVEVLGWREIPLAGDIMLQVESEQQAHEVVSYRKASVRHQRLHILSGEVTPSAVSSEQGKGKPRVSMKEYDTSSKLDVVVKGDVNGSVEAVLDALETYKSQQIKLSVLHSGVGPVSENDVKMAAPFKGVVFGFNVKVPREVQSLADQLGIPVKLHKIIYKLFEDLKNELSSKLPPVTDEVITGEAVVKQVFQLTGAKKATVAGCRVKQGSLARKDTKYRVLRDGQVIHEGKLTSLKQGSDDISTAKKEMECGVTLEKFKNFEEGDIIQCVTISLLKQEIDWDWGF